MWPDELIFTLPGNFSNFYSDKAATKSEGRNDQYREYTIYTMDICTFIPDFYDAQADPGR